VGSLLRPQALKAAFTQLREGAIDQTAYARVLDHEIREAVRRQEDVGLRSITDGEFGRGSWFGFFFERMDGFRLEPSAFRFRDDQGRTYEWPTCLACGRIHRHHGVTTDEYKRLRGMTRQTPKVTMPSPSAFHFFRFNDPVDKSAYPDIDVYWNDLIEVFRSELKELGEIGCTYVQLDEVPLAMLCDPGIQEQVRRLGGDPDALIEMYVVVLARVLAGAPPQMTFGLHLCRGNFRGRWMAEGGYDPIAERLFNVVPVHAFFLEYDSPRAGDFSPLRFVPEEKSVVLGLISSKSAELESKPELQRRIEEASRYVPIERLALSPQCGFASVAAGNAMTEAQEMAKLRLVVDVANKTWD
jgi:5-methyltetrahydropteroyltriglutamate--homocysteine methyltransferase